jgi:murein DD-endopeptidase MepM/ murein hydrolase activator NlpD
VKSTHRLSIVALILVMISLACVRNAFSNEMTDEEKIRGTASVLATQAILNPPRKPGELAPTPTPDKPHTLPTLRSDPEKYYAQAGDTYGKIANDHGITLQELIEENDILDENMLSIGQELDIPAGKPVGKAPSFKVIPDSELVFGPTTTTFSAAGFMEGRQGYLNNYSETVDDIQLAGVEVINKVARDYSVNPRLLLALLEYMGGWVTNPRPAAEQVEFPLGYDDPAYKGLYLQLSFAANNLNRGFYLWQANALGQFILKDGSLIVPDATVNAGTAGVQYFFSKMLGKDAWERAVTDHGLISQYQFLFSYPFDLGMEPLLPRGLRQPKWHLPFEPGVEWSFTGGPHSAWGTGSAWGALDFAPPGDMLGCNTSDDWVVAMADGKIIRANNGAVVEDLDGDGKEQTGWTILYMHIENRDRVERGTIVKAGDRIGHPSCEGGISTGTHLHIARRYNGTWIAADGSIPFVMDEWTSSGRGTEYDGELTRENITIEAWDGRKTENQIKR